MPALAQSCAKAPRHELNTSRRGKSGLRSFIKPRVARGLVAAHDRGIVNRDLKPENIFLARDGRIKILEFGLAKLTRPHNESSGADTPTLASQTEPGLVLGTVGYVSPEQVRGKAADARSDIFSVGTILYEMAARRLPPISDHLICRFPPVANGVGWLAWQWLNPRLVDSLAILLWQLRRRGALQHKDAKQHHGVFLSVSLDTASNGIQHVIYCCCESALTSWNSAVHIIFGCETTGNGVHGENSYLPWPLELLVINLALSLSRSISIVAKVGRDRSFRISETRVGHAIDNAHGLPSRIRGRRLFAVTACRVSRPGRQVNREMNRGLPGRAVTAILPIRAYCHGWCEWFLAPLLDVTENWPRGQQYFV